MRSVGGKLSGLDDWVVDNRRWLMMFKGMSKGGCMEAEKGNVSRRFSFGALLKFDRLRFDIFARRAVYKLARLCIKASICTLLKITDSS